jgi:hypothetical protein
MLYVSGYWSQNGFGTLPIDFWVSNKNAILTAYMSLIYYLGNNDHFLNITVLNSFHNILSGILVVLTSFWLNTSIRINTVLFIALLQPLGFSSDIFWRDSVGQFFIICSIVLLLNNKSNYSNIISLFISVFLAFLHRTAYALISPLVFFFDKFYLSNSKDNIIFRGFIVLLTTVVFVSFGNLFLELTKVGNYLTVDGNTNTAISKGGSAYIFLVGLVGPFPWTQIFDKSIPGYEYIMYDMLQASYALVIYFLLAKELYSRGLKNFDKNEKIILLSVFIYVLFGLFSYGHISYTTVASLLLLSIIRHLRIINFLKTWLFLISLYSLLSLGWVLF